MPRALPDKKTLHCACSWYRLLYLPQKVALLSKESCWGPGLPLTDDGKVTNQKATFFLHIYVFGSVIISWSIKLLNMLLKVESFFWLSRKIVKLPRVHSIIIIQQTPTSLRIKLRALRVLLMSSISGWLAHPLPLFMSHQLWAHDGLNGSAGWRPL